MTTLLCPKCRQPMPEDALDRGHCPGCGFPLDGPLVLDAGTRRSRLGLYVVGGVALAAGAAGAYAAFADGLGVLPPRAPAVAQIAPIPAEAVVALAPPPRLAKPRPAEAAPPLTNTPPDETKVRGPRPVGVVMKVDPRIAPTRHFDHPDDTATLPDLNSGTRVVLTGRVHTLRMGSVHGNGSLDASGLVADEVVISGDLNGDASVTLNAPNGKVTIGGYVVGNAKLLVDGPGGEVVLAGSGRVAGNATVTATAKRFDAAGKVSGGARVRLTLTTGGSMRLTAVEENATVGYRRSAATDPPLAVEKGNVAAGAKVFAE